MGNFVSSAQGCSLCPRLSMSRKRIMFPRGNLDAKIMVIVENPTKMEDMAGEPLVGWAWEEFSDVLLLAGLERKELWMTYLTKCRSPWGKRVKASEIKNCSQYLEEELEAVKPMFVFAFSAAVFNYFVPKEKKGKSTYNKFLNRLFKRHTIGRPWGTFSLIPIPSPSYSNMSERTSFIRKTVECVGEARDETKGGCCL